MIISMKKETFVNKIISKNTCETVNLTSRFFFLKGIFKINLVKKKKHYRISPHITKYGLEGMVPETCVLTTVICLEAEVKCI